MGLQPRRIRVDRHVPHEEPGPGPLPGLDRDRVADEDRQSIRWSLAGAGPSFPWRRCRNSLRSNSLYTVETFCFAGGNCREAAGEALQPANEFKLPVEETEASRSENDRLTREVPMNNRLVLTYSSCLFRFRFKRARQRDDARRPGVGQRPDERPGCERGL